MLPDPRALRGRPLADALELARLWLVLLGVDLRMSLLPGSLNRPWLFRRPGRPAAGPGPRSSARIERLARLMRSASRFRIRSASPCLCLALALRSRLASLGLDATLVYGARRSAIGSPAIEAHAWLELGSLRLDPLGGPSSFAPFGRSER